MSIGFGILEVIISDFGEKSCTGVVGQKHGYHGF